MPLEKQVIPVPFKQGVETKADPRQLSPGQLTTLENAGFAGQDMLSCRNGYSQLSQLAVGTTITPGTFVAPYKQDLLCSDGSQIYGYAPSSNTWTVAGKYEDIAVTSSPVTQGSQTQIDSAVSSGGVQMVAANVVTGTSGINYTLFDYASGDMLYTAFIAGAAYPRCLAFGNYLLLSFVDTASNNIRYLTFSLNVVNPYVPSSIVTLVTTRQAVSTPVFDAITVGTRAYFAWNNAAGGISLQYLDSSPGPGFVTSSVLAVAGDQANSTGSAPLALFADAASNIWVAFGNASNVTKYFIRDQALSGTPVLATTTIETTTALLNRVTAIYNTAQTLGQIFCEVTGNAIRLLSVSVAGGTSAIQAIVRGVAIGGKAFLWGQTGHFVSYFYSPGGGKNDSQFTVFVINQYGQVVAKVSQGKGIIFSALSTNVNQVASGVFQFLYQRIVGGYEELGVSVRQYGIYQARLDFSVTAPQKVQAAEDFHVSGGMVTCFDGVTLAEHGFHSYPDNLSVSTATTGGSLTAGTRSYVATYEWTDRYGQVHRSCPSTPLTVTNTGSTSLNTLTIPTLTLTGKSNVIIQVYRTLAGQTVYYLVTSTNLNAAIPNSTTTDSVTFTDNTADSLILGNQELYTTGGEVENIAAPATQLMIPYRTRVIVVPSEQPLTWWVSKQIVPAVPLEFSDLLAQNIDSRGGPITALGVMDEKLIFFKDQAIFYTAGDGPALNGGNSDYVGPQLVATDVGCPFPKSVVLMPFGLMFQSRKGFWLLARDLTTAYIGSQVEAYAGDTVTGAALVPNTTEVRFTLASGKALNYDYFTKQWAVHTNVSAIDCAVYNGAFAYLSPAGLVSVETPGSYADNGAVITQKMTTGWMQVGALQGFQRVWKMLILGSYMSPHTLQVSFAYDYDPTLYPVAPIVVSSNPVNYQFRTFPPRQKCEAIQVTITITPTGTGAGASLSAIAFEAGMKQGANKMSAGVSYG